MMSEVSNYYNNNYYQILDAFFCSISTTTIIFNLLTGQL